MNISLIIPCYKDSATLSFALDSAINQTYPLHEIIVVNDASPESDRIVDILSGYPGIRHIINQRNLGLASSRNIGVKHATGEIITFMDADDVLHPQKIELQMSVYNDYSAFFTDLQEISHEALKLNPKRYSMPTNCKTFKSSKRILMFNRLTGASLLICRDLFLSIGGYDIKLKSCEDFDFSLRLLDENVPILKITLPLYLYRFNPNGMSKNILNISFWESKVIKKYYKSRQFFFWDQFIIFLWIFKHLIRYESCKDLKLLNLINKNTRLINRFLLLNILLGFIKFFRIPRVVLILFSFKRFIFRRILKN